MERNINITDVFEAKLCDLCGSNELSQFIRINENFIEYCGVYYPFREILAECLSFHVSKDEAESMEMCLDCKERLLSFYHFKRKIREAQDHIQKKSSSTKKSPYKSQKRSRLVYDIYRIIESYTENCSITSIKVEKGDGKLVIKSRAYDEPLENSIIKQEPMLMVETIENDYFYEDNEEFDSSERLDVSDIPATTSSSQQSIPSSTKVSEPAKKRQKRERPKKRKENEYDIGTLELSVVDVVNVFNADTNKLNDKYGDVFRKLMLSKYQTRIVVNFSFIGKARIRVTVRCEKCKDNYKIEGQREDFVNRVATQCSIWSTRTDFCRCGS